MHTYLIITVKKLIDYKKLLFSYKHDKGPIIQNYTLIAKITWQLNHPDQQKWKDVTITIGL